MTAEQRLPVDMKEFGGGDDGGVLLTYAITFKLLPELLTLTGGRAGAPEGSRQRGDDVCWEITHCPPVPPMADGWMLGGCRDAAMSFL